MKNNQINVLICSCGRRVELVKAFKKARDMAGVQGNVVCADMSANAPALFFADIKERVPRLSADNYLQCLIDICNKDEIDLIVPTIDTELQLLADNKSYIQQNTHAKVLVSDPEVVRICNDKILTADFFNKNGFDAPVTLSQQDLDNKNYDFPLFIKPLDGSSSINTYKIYNQKQLDFFADYIPNPIIQPCISGKEYTIDAFLDFDSNIISVVPRQRLAIRSGEILKGKIDLDNFIIQQVSQMLNVLRPIGHITVQGFLCDDGKFRYIEINPRFGGGAPMSISAGANSCLWLYELLQGKTIDKNTINIKDKVVFSRFDDSIMIEE